MQNMFQILLMAALGSIVYTDLKWRLIYVGQLLILASMVISIRLFTAEPLYFGIHLLLNNLFLLLNWSLLWLWYRFSTGHAPKLIDRLVGRGDLWFMVVVSPMFEFDLFISYYTVSLALTLLFFFVSRYVFNRTVATIPLAGCMALCMILFNITNYFFR